MSRMPIWNAEADADDELAEVDMNVALGSSYGVSQMVPTAVYDEMALRQLQQQQLHQTLASIPEVVRRFILQLQNAIHTSNTSEILLLYEGGWNRLSEKFYAKAEWPEAELIAPLVGDDGLFLILYRELYYRHVYSRLGGTVNLDDRFHSYENSCELFNYLLNSPSPPPLTLPDQWLWDIIDEFIYQFQQFCAFRSRVATKTDEEINVLAQDSGQVWSCYSVLNVLYSFIQKSQITEILKLMREKGLTEEEVIELVDENGEKIIGDYGQRKVYRMLGWFSLVGLLRVHTLLGDFTLALKCLEGVELGQRTPPSIQKITACNVTTHYYAGFAYLSLRRYPDAIKVFVFILNFIARTRQYHTRSYQYEAINKTADRMYALFLLCHALSPSAGRVDDQVQSVVKEKYGEVMSRVMKGDDPTPFTELYSYASPKFISPHNPPYHSIPLLATWVQNPPVEPVAQHLDIFMHDVSLRIGVRDLRSYLKLYKSIDAKKLSGYLSAQEHSDGDGDDSVEGIDEERMVQMMMVLKMTGRSLVRGGDDGKQSRPRKEASPSTGAGLLDGSVAKISDVDFVINENLIHIVESTIGRRYAGWFIRNTEYAQRVHDAVCRAPLPKQNLKVAPGTVAALSGQGNTSGKKVTWAK